MIYLDNAATTLEKPPAVSRAMCWAMRHAGGAGRSAHPPAMLGADIIYDTRRLAAQVFDVPDPTRVIFTANATQALNMALYAMAQTHRHFAISGFEHNAVYRPDIGAGQAEQPQADHAAQCTVGGCAAAGTGGTGHSRRRRLLCAVPCVQRLWLYPTAGTIGCAAVGTWHSTGFGCVTIRRCFAAFRFQAAQSCRSRDAGTQRAIRPAGNGNAFVDVAGSAPRRCCWAAPAACQSRADMPDFLPDRLESGTVNVAGIAGLFEGLQFVSKLGESEIAAWECKLRDLVTEKLREVPGVTVYASPNPQKQTGVLSFTCRQLPCEIVAQRLAEHNICVRAGLHCAPLAHSTAGTLETGTVRISPGWFQSVRQVRKFCDILAHICGKESDQICDEVFTH